MPGVFLLGIKSCIKFVESFCYSQLTTCCEQRCSCNGLFERFGETGFVAQDHLFGCYDGLFGKIEFAGQSEEIHVNRMKGCCTNLTGGAGGVVGTRVVWDGRWVDCGWGAWKG